jgi:hypothetical protein
VASEAAALPTMTRPVASMVWNEPADRQQDQLRTP